MSIQLTQIYSLAIPLIIIVLVQVVFMVLFSIFILFKGLGKDYDAVVMVEDLLAMVWEQHQMRWLI